MQLAGRNPVDFNVQIVRLPSEYEVAQGAADQPGTAAGLADQGVDPAQRPRERGVCNAKTNGHSAHQSSCQWSSNEEIIGLSIGIGKDR